MIGIYSLKNNITGDIYVGQSINLRRRMMEHRCPCSTKGNRLICKALKKYGFDNFTFSVLEECKKSELDSKEIFWISKLHASYNMTIGGRGVAGNVLSDEARKHLSDCAKKQWENMTDEQKAYKISILKGPKVGHKVSKETRQKLREKNLGKKLSDEVKKKISIANKGKMPHPPMYKPIFGYSEKEFSFYYFRSIKDASKHFGAQNSSIVHALKGERKHFRNLVWKYWSVETMGDECNPVGVTLPHAQVRDSNRGEEIVHTIEMVNQWISDIGLLQLCQRSGQFKKILAAPVHEGEYISGDEFDEDYVFDKTKRTSDKVIGYMAKFELLNGFVKIAYWNIDKVKAHAQKFSQAFRAGYNSPWKSDFDAMAQKTVLKSILKYAPKSIEMQNAVTFDQAVVNTNVSDVQDLDIDSFAPEYIDNIESEKKDKLAAGAAEAAKKSAEAKEGK